MELSGEWRSMPSFICTASSHPASHIQPSCILHASSTHARMYAANANAKHDRCICNYCICNPGEPVWISSAVTVCLPPFQTSLFAIPLSELGMGWGDLRNSLSLWIRMLALRRHFWKGRGVGLELGMGYDSRGESGAGFGFGFGKEGWDGRGDLGMDWIWLDCVGLCCVGGWNGGMPRV